MNRFGCLLLLVMAVASAQAVHTAAPAQTVHAQSVAPLEDATGTSVPTVTIIDATPVDVPTVHIPRRDTPTPVPVARKHHHKKKPVTRAHPAPTAAPAGQWITAYLTSYCPGSAGWLSSSGMPVFYGMLANNYYRFGTRVYIPVLGMVGTVYDRLSAFPVWNHFDVWSATCYGTPTGWYPVAIESR